MKLAVLVLLAACHQAGGDDYPLAPSGNGGPPIAIGGGGTGGGGGDAGTDAVDSDGGVPVAGRVCLLADLRTLTACLPTGAKGLTVTLGTRTTTTLSDDGAFSFVAQLGDGFFWHVKGATDQRIVTSVIPLGTDYTLPAITTAAYTGMLGSNGVTIIDQQGSAVVRVVRGTAPVTGAVATAPAANPPVLYDTANNTIWGQTSTGDLGVVWIPVIPLAAVAPTTATITITPPQPAVAVKAIVPVENGSITFVTRDIQ